MQSVARSPKSRRPRPLARPIAPTARRWTYSLITATLFALIVGSAIGVWALFTYKDYFPESIHYRISVAEGRINDVLRPPPASVPTPAVARAAAPPVFQVPLQKAEPTVVPVAHSDGEAASQVDQAAATAGEDEVPAAGAQEESAADPLVQPGEDPGATIEETEGSSAPVVENAEASAETTAPVASEAETTGAAESAAQDSESTLEADAPPVAEEAPPAVAEQAPAAPAVELAPIQQSILLNGVRHEYQKMNNCGPVTIGMQLSFFGRPDTQVEAAAFLKPNRDDRNVSPGELAAYARSIGFQSFVGVGGNLDLLKQLVSNQFPVIVESWFIPEPNDEMGHYLLLIGYDEATGEFIFNDSYHGPAQREKMEHFDPLWQVFNRTFVVSYPPERAVAAEAILAGYLDPAAMYGRAAETAQAELTADPNNRYAWFNLGSSLVGLGQMEPAVQAFDQARLLQLPWRMLWYQFGPFEAYLAVGRYQDVIDLATSNLNTVGELEESYYWRGRAYQAQGNLDAARADYERALRFNPNFAPATEALVSLS